MVIQLFKYLIDQIYQSASNSVCQHQQLFYFCNPLILFSLDILDRCYVSCLLCHSDSPHESLFPHDSNNLSEFLVVPWSKYSFTHFSRFIEQIFSLQSWRLQFSSLWTSSMMRKSQRWQCCLCPRGRLVITNLHETIVVCIAIIWNKNIMNYWTVFGTVMICGLLLFRVKYIFPRGFLSMSRKLSHCCQT
jgi:hypothetical protein